MTSSPAAAHDRAQQKGAVFSETLMVFFLSQCSAPTSIMPAPGRKAVRGHWGARSFSQMQKNNPPAKPPENNNASIFFAPAAVFSLCFTPPPRFFPS